MSVTVFTRPGCVQCTATIRAFEKNNVEVAVVDIDKDPKGEETVRGLNYRGLPVVTAGDKHWCGFNPGMIAEAATVYATV